ncbi:MAG: DUF3817 domain-containing protein [Campylobacterota bacterium]|nr:DUF3817 domain-containing protein [Campylobacterota bacterium]
MSISALKRFRVVATVEGLSFLILLFIAMPLKYVYGMPMATKIVGMLHGGLFLWFIKAQIDAHKEYGFSTKFNILAFLASIIPFATFYLEKEINKIVLEESNQK